MNTTTEQTPDTPTPEEIWRILRENAEQMKEHRAEADRQTTELKKQMADTDRRLRKAEGLFTTQWGKLLESLVEGDLVPLLRQRYGAVAYLDADDSVIKHAERRGLFVIRATGNSASILNQPDFKPRVFS
ncbi:MAG: hypothetical protein F4060_07520 [Holophagales bacterium]|nr:hypothetical protein [Holophagales bacterium]MYG29707.1 hypothetical protein [Holophagales bacterium]MYI79775.1 hypothetical protein [Holophagales bacterium]